MNVKVVARIASIVMLAVTSLKGAEANLIPMMKDLWTTSVGAQGIPSQWGKEAQNLESHLKEFLSVDIQKGSSGLIFSFTGIDKINLHRDKGGNPWVWSRAVCRQQIPVDASKKYQLSFRASGHVSEAKGRNRPFFSVKFVDKNGKAISSKYYEFYPQPSGLDYHAEIYPPEGTAKLAVAFEICGLTRMTIDQLKLCEAERERGFDILLHPMCCFDNAFHLTEGQAGGLSFAPLNKSGKKPTAPYLHVTLPKGFEIVGFRRGFPAKEILSDEKNGSRTWEIQLPGSNQWYGEPHPYMRAYMLITSVHTTSPKEYVAHYQAFDNDYATEVRTFKLKIDPPVKGARPKLFLSGVQVCESSYLEAPFKYLANIYDESGFNWLFLHPWEKWQSQEIAKRGISRFGAGCGGNGYWLWDEKDDQRPDYTRFIGIDGKTLHPYMACPASIYNRTPYYLEKFLPWRKQRLGNDDAFDYFISNWEPMGMLETGGCYCENCKRDFITFTGLDATKVNAVWPNGVVERFRQHYFRFKSWQHGRYVGTLEEDMRKAGAEFGKNSGLCVEITSSHMVDDEHVLSGRDNAFDVKWYADKVQWINPWGPYIFTPCDNPTRVPPGDHVRLLRRAREVKRYLDKIRPDRTKHPKLLGFPNGYIRDTGWTPPEELTLDILTYYVSGWQGSMTYYFLGLDNRYWQAHATANNIIAKTEDVVMTGEHLPIGSTTVEVLSPFPPSVYQTPILDTETYRKGDTFIVAVGNFWQYGEAFYRLKLPLTDCNKYYTVVDESNGRVYASSKNTHFTGKELTDGVLLETPRLAWSFYRISPATNPPINALVKEDLIEKLANRRSALQKLLDADLAYLRNTLAEPEQPSDCSIIKQIEHEGMTAETEIIDGKVLVKVRDSDNQWIVDPNRGAKIASWLRGNCELSFPDDQRFGLAEDGLWVPGARMKNAMNLIEVEKISGGVALVFTRKLNTNDDPCMKGVKHTKRMEFTKDTAKISVDLHNLSGDEVRFAFRWFNTPGLLRANERNPSGSATMIGTNGVETFRRKFVPRYYRMAGVDLDREIRRNFMVADDGLMQETILKPEVTFLAHNRSVALKMSVSPANLVHGFAICDDSRLEAPTFEPIFNKLSLPTGQRFSATLELKVSSCR